MSKGKLLVARRRPLRLFAGDKEPEWPRPVFRHDQTATALRGVLRPFRLLDFRNLREKLGRGVLETKWPEKPP